MSDPSVLVWLRADLRSADNPALLAARREGLAVIPVFTWSPEDEGDWPPGGASRLWLHHALARLDNDLQARGSRLILRRGRAVEVLATLVRDVNARAVHWNRRYEPAAVAVERDVGHALQRAGCATHEHQAGLLVEPWSIATAAGTPLRVFTPFWKRWLAMVEPTAPLPAPASLQAPPAWPSSMALEELGLCPPLAWTGVLERHWDLPGTSAEEALERFVESAIARYDVGRDFPAGDDVSRLSPYLHTGELGPRQAWAAAHEGGGITPSASAGAWLRQLAWREFAHHLLHHFPATTNQPLRPEFEHFPWQQQPGALRRWQRGATGYPLVDAGMRELWHTGWMHNRVRMVVASFLVKHLLVHWREGARWFWDTLVDADLANNTFGWQWVSGCGADAAPYFRIFNPVAQGERFDAEGEYVRRWVPELSRLPARFVHQPWTAPGNVLAYAGVHLGENYPRPMVEHAAARKAALAAYAGLRS